MTNSPWRINATPIFLSPSHMALHHPAVRPGFLLVYRVIGAPVSFQAVWARIISKPRWLSFTNLSSSCAGGRPQWLSAFTDLQHAFEESSPWLWYELCGHRCSNCEVNFCYVHFDRCRLYLTGDSHSGTQLTHFRFLHR